MLVGELYDLVVATTEHKFGGEAAIPRLTGVGVVIHHSSWGMWGCSNRY